MCQLAGVSRASYYRHWEVTAPDEAELAVRAAIHEEVLKHRRRYGSRRVSQALRRRGMVVNRKRVSRIMREDNLLAIRHRKYILTTDAQHDCQVYLNLAGRMTVTGINQLWVADITYIRLRKEFVFLAVVIDRYSRKAIGWALFAEFKRSRSPERAAAGDPTAPTATGSGASLRSGDPVCEPGIHSGVDSPSDDAEHEPSG